MGLIRPATPGFLVTLIATILLLVVSFSVPWFKSVYFLKAAVNQNNQSGFVTFGVLGYCTSINGAAASCTSAKLGYKFDANTLLGDNIKFLQIPDVVTSWVTWALVLHIVAFGLAAVAALFGLLAHVRELAMTCFSSCISGFGAVVALLAFIFDLVLFFTARSRINSVQGGSASIGIAVWLTLIAWILLFFSGCFYSIGRCCVSRRPRGSKFNNSGGNGNGAGNNFSGYPKNDALENGNNKDSYGESMRLDAVKAEADRKARQAVGERGLPAFPSAEERKPLHSNYEATYAEDDDEPTSPYRDHNAIGGAAGRVNGPRSPHRQPTSHSAVSNAAPSGYGAAAYATGYVPGQEGSRTIDEYYTPSNAANTMQPSYPPQTPSRASQRQQPGYADRSEGYPAQNISNTDQYYANQQPSAQGQVPSHHYGEYAAGAAGLAAAAGVGYAAYHHSQNDGGHNPAPSQTNDQYLQSGENYGHGYDPTSYHSAVSHQQEPSHYNQDPYAYDQPIPNPHSSDQIPQLSVSSPQPYGSHSTYPSSNVLPPRTQMSLEDTAYPSSNAIAQYDAYSTTNNTPFYTADTRGGMPLNTASSQSPPGLRPESNATSYFPYGTNPIGQQEGNVLNRHPSSSPGGLHTVQEASHSTTGEPPEYTSTRNNYYGGGWAQKS